MYNAVMRFIEAKCVAGKGQTARKKWFDVLTLNIHCFHTFKNIREY